MSEKTSKGQDRPARFAAGAIFVTWVSISAGANYAHGDDAIGGGLMMAAPVGFAATTFLLEMLISRGHKLGWPAGLAMVLVAAVSGVASYVGLFGLALEHGVPRETAALLPLAFDGVVLASSLALRTLSRRPAVDTVVDKIKDLAVDMSTFQERAIDGHVDIPVVDMDKPVDSVDIPVVDSVDTVAVDKIEMDKPVDTEPGVGMDIQSWMDESEAALSEAGQELAAEVTAYVAAAPAPVARDSAKIDHEAARRAAALMLGEGMGLVQISNMIGESYGVSGKTVRRQSWWPALSGRPVSGPPASRESDPLN